MATPIWLTDEDADIAGYKRAKVPSSQAGPDISAAVTTQPNRSDCPSLVRLVTNTVVGPAVIPVVRQVGSAIFDKGWITDPLSGPNLQGNNWVLHCWASATAAAVGVRFEVFKYTNVEGTSVISADSAVLDTTCKDIVSTSNTATSVTLAEGDRLVIKLSLVGTGLGTATISYNGLYGRAEGDTFLMCPDTLTVDDDIPDDALIAVRTILRDQSSMNPQLDDSEIARYVRNAVNTYSVNRPMPVSYYYSGDGNTYKFPLPPKYVWGFSRIISTEYPADQQIPNIEETLDWEIRESMLGPQPLRFIQFRTIIPDNGTNNCWVQYTTKHVYCSDYSTIPSEDFDAVLWLAGSYCAAALASRGAGATDSSISADAVNYRDLEIRWGSVAKRLKDLYMSRVIEPDSATPVGSTEEWKPILSVGMPFMWHSRRVRRVR